MKKLISSIFLLFSLCHFGLLADVRLPQLVSDNMVLQRDTPIKLWGWAEPGEQIVVYLDDQRIGSVTSDNNEWSLMLPAQPAGSQHTLRIVANNTITINNLAFGELWLASGQSNMALSMERVKKRYAEDIANADFPDIRHFTLPTVYAFDKPQSDYPDHLTVKWQSLDPQSVLAFSATAFFFARDLHQQYNVPIGIINASVGGTGIEAWMSAESLAAFPKAAAEAKLFQNSAHLQSVKDADKQRSDAWYQYINQNDAGLAEKWYRPEYDDSAWKSFELPGYWQDQGFAPENGVLWLRKSIDVPSDMAGKSAKLMMGRIVDADTVYVNGLEVGSTSYQYPPRRYTVPANVLKAGSNEIAIRVISNRGKGGFVSDKPYWLGSEENNIILSGQWKLKRAVSAEALPNSTFIQYKPTGVYNAMIAPAHPMAIKGVIWYQGESNVSQPDNYKAMFSSMVSDWRAAWNNPDLPCISVQLANLLAPNPQPNESNWAELREQQRLSLSIPNTAMAVIIDAGEWNDIHPLNKYAPGHRLALAAQHLAYGNQALTYSGPQIEKVEAVEGGLLLSFSQIGSGLLAKDGRLNEFAIAGEDGEFVWAQADIVGEQVRVYNDAIPKPTQVRYAWADNPDNANLYNKEGLPASPFAVSLQAN